MQSETLKLTAEQRARFDEDGFFLVEEALTKHEVADLLAAVDELYERYAAERALTPDAPFQMRNIAAADPRFKQLIDHPVMLPLVSGTSSSWEQMGLQLESIPCSTWSLLPNQIWPFLSTLAGASTWYSVRQRHSSLPPESRR